MASHRANYDRKYAKKISTSEFSALRLLYGLTFVLLPMIIVFGIFSKFIIPLTSYPVFDWSITWLRAPLWFLTAILAVLATYWVNKPGKFSSGIFFLCPENIAFLVVNTLTKGLRCITQGFNFKYHWEEVDERNKFVLDLRAFAITKPGETQERAIVNVTGRVSYKIDARSSASLSNYNQLGDPKQADDLIKKLVEAAFGYAVIRIMLEYKLDNFKTSANQVKELIAEELGIGSGRVSELEQRLGVILLDLVIEDMTVPEDSPVAKVNALSAKLRLYQQIIEELVKDGMNREDAIELIALADPDSKLQKFVGAVPGMFVGSINEKQGGQS